MNVGIFIVAGGADVAGAEVVVEGGAVVVETEIVADGTGLGESEVVNTAVPGAEVVVTV